MSTNAVLYVGWYRESGKRQRWRATAPMETIHDARELARQAGVWLNVKSFDTCVVRQGEDPNKRKGK